jgi:hypothetical protein
MTLSVDQLKLLLRCVSNRVHSRNLNDPEEKSEYQQLLPIHMMITEEIRIVYKAQNEENDSPN